MKGKMVFSYRQLLSPQTKRFSSPNKNNIKMLERELKCKHTFRSTPLGKFPTGRAYKRRESSSVKAERIKKEGAQPKKRENEMKRKWTK